MKIYSDPPNTNQNLMNHLIINNTFCTIIKYLIDLFNLRVKHLAATDRFPSLPCDRCKSALHTIPNAPWPIGCRRAIRSRAISQLSTFSFCNSISTASSSLGLMSLQKCTPYLRITSSGWWHMNNDHSSYLTQRACGSHLT